MMTFRICIVASFTILAGCTWFGSSSVDVEPSAASAPTSAADTEKAAAAEQAISKQGKSEGNDLHKFAEIRAAIKSQGFLPVLTEANNAPYEYYEGAEIVGYDIDFAKEIAHRLGVEIKVIEKPFYSVTYEIDNFSYGIIVGGINPMLTREEGFTNITFGYVPQVTLSMAGNPVVAEADFAGMEVGVQTASQARNLLELRKVAGLAVKRVRGFESQTLVTDALITRKIDVAVVDEPHARHLATESKKKLIAGAFTVVDEPLAVMVPNSNEDYVAMLTQIAEGMHNDGTVDHLYELYFKRTRNPANSSH